MKLADIVIGGEYAMNRDGFNARSAYPARLVRVRVTDKVKVAGDYYNTGRTYTGRTDIHVEAVDDGVLLGPSYEPQSRKLVTTARAFSATWQDHQAKLEQHEKQKAAQQEMRRQLSAALGTLGLHDQRYMHLKDADAASAEVTLSGAELLKLAARAESLVELERLIGAWYQAEEGDLWATRGFLFAKTIEWASHHDFSMLDNDTERVPSREEIEAELHEAAKYDSNE